MLPSWLHHPIFHVMVLCLGFVLVMDEVADHSFSGSLSAVISMCFDFEFIGAAMVALPPPTYAAFHRKRYTQWASIGSHLSILAVPRQNPPIQNFLLAVIGMSWQKLLSRALGESLGAVSLPGNQNISVFSSTFLDQFIKRVGDHLPVKVVFLTNVNGKDQPRSTTFAYAITST